MISDMTPSTTRKLTENKQKAYCPKTAEKWSHGLKATLTQKGPKSKSTFDKVLTLGCLEPPELGCHRYTLL